MDDQDRTLYDAGFDIGDIVYIIPGSATDEKLHNQMSHHVRQLQMAFLERGIQFNPATDFPPGVLHGWEVNLELMKEVVLHGIRTYITITPVNWNDIRRVAATDGEATTDEKNARSRRGGRKTRRTQRKTRRRRQSRRRV